MSNKLIKNNNIKYRIETDSLGSVKVSEKFYYGAQTQRSIENFKIGKTKMPLEVIRSLVIIKRSAAIVNNNLNKLPEEKAKLIIKAADIIINAIDNHDQNIIDNFPLVIWQTGSGTQSNMNVNEVIASIANEIINGTKGGKAPIHPNDHVNMGQSSNDTFPTSMHIATIDIYHQKLLPALDNLFNKLNSLSNKWQHVIKIGRTHMQDATPLTVGQEWSAFAHQIKMNMKKIQNNIEDIYYLAQGATAVGTGINSAVNFDNLFCEEVSKYTKYQFKSAANKFEALASNDSLVGLSGSLNNLAVSLMKISNDIRLLACGPRCGINELHLPANEPGSSIMPGKVNPTQIEAMNMVCAKVMGNHVATTIAGSNGHLQLNVYKPVIIYNILESIEILSDAMNSFTDKCLKDIKLNHNKITELMNNSLMLVTALNEHIGYDNAAKIAKYAFENNLTLKEASIKLDILNEEEFNKYVDPSKMISPK